LASPGDGDRRDPHACGTDARRPGIPGDAAVLVAVVPGAAPGRRDRRRGTRPMGHDAEAARRCPSTPARRRVGRLTAADRVALMEMTRLDDDGWLERTWPPERAGYAWRRKRVAGEHLGAGLIELLVSNFALPRGPDGAHKLTNRSDDLVRVGCAGARGGTSGAGP